MIYPQVEYKEWADFYGLETETECRNCGAIRVLNKPFAYKSYRGLETSDVKCHACGHGKNIAVMASKDPREVDEWGELIEEME